MEKSEIHTVEMVRKIRDEQAAVLSSKSEAEVLAFFRAAGEAARKRLRGSPAPGSRGQGA